MPEPRGLGMTMRVYVGSNHDGDTVTRWSRTAFIILLKSAPIYWISKKKLRVRQVLLEVSFVL